MKQGPIVPEMPRAKLEWFARGMARGSRLRREESRQVGAAILAFLEGFDATVAAWKHLDRGLDIPRYTAMVAKQAKRRANPTHDDGE